MPMERGRDSRRFHYRPDRSRNGPVPSPQLPDLPIPFPKTANDLRLDPFAPPPHILLVPPRPRSMMAARMDTAAFALLRELQRRLTADFDLADIAGDLLRVGLAATDCKRALACTRSPRGDPLAVATLGPPLLLPLDEEVAAFAPLMQAAAESGRFLTTEDAAKDDRFRALAHATGLKARRVGILPARGRTKTAAAIAFSK